MKLVTPFALLFAVALAVTSVVIAQDGAGQDKEERPKARLVKPWSQMTTLSVDQKEKITQIHADANEAMRKIRERERADIMALMTEENKTELTALMETDRAEQKARAAQRRLEGDKDDPEKDKDK